MTQEEKEALLALSGPQLKKAFKAPSQTIINGFHIHMDFSAENEALVLTVFDKLITFLLSENLRPTSTRLYAPRENGPHVLGGWEVKFETNDQSILSEIGIPIGWLMCNRQGLPVFIHPVTWTEGDYREELQAHEKYSFFLGNMPELDLSFFSNKIPNYANEINML